MQARSGSRESHSGGGSQSSVADVAVIGGGFAGTAVAVQLARLASRPLRIVMFDRAGAFGRGVAYSPGSDDCVLNVRAKVMGAFPDAEDDFLGWLRRNGYGAEDPELGERFLPRRLYGDYLCSLLDRCGRRGVMVERRAAHVVGLAASGSGYVVETACASRTVVSAVVMAIGNLPPAGLGSASLGAAMDRYALNPWDLLRSGSIDRDAGVFIVGTGLSALDVLVQLRAHAHRGPIAMLSRHGRFPLAHAAPPPGPAPALAPLTGTPPEIFRALREAVRAATAQGRTWHEVIDGVRPQANRIWQSWSPEQQQQFYRHLASIWNVHRHRTPQELLTLRDELIAARQLQVHRGRLTSVERRPDGFGVTFAESGRAAAVSVRADAIVNCTGPRRAVDTSGDALVETVLARRLARPGPSGFGFAAAADGRLNGEDRAGAIYALGTPLRGMLSESSAVREIRLQALTIAQAIVARTAPESLSAARYAANAAG